VGTNERQESAATLLAINSCWAGCCAHRSGTACRGVSGGHAMYVNHLTGFRAKSTVRLCVLSSSVMSLKPALAAPAPDGERSCRSTATANHHHLRCGTTDGGDQNLIASFKPHASVDLSGNAKQRPSAAPQQAARVRGDHSAPGDRGFESGLLQRGVRCELEIFGSTSSR
jgi:hypothetical protein